MMCVTVSRHPLVDTFFIWVCGIIGFVDTVFDFVLEQYVIHINRSAHTHRLTLCSDLLVVFDFAFLIADTHVDVVVHVVTKTKRVNTTFAVVLIYKLVFLVEIDR